MLQILSVRESDIIVCIFHSCGRKSHQFKGKVWYGNRVNTHFMDINLNMKIVSFKQFNVAELCKLLFRAFINTKLPKLPKENYNYIF